MEQTEEISRMTVPLPSHIKRDLKINAAKNDRPLSKEIVNTLRAGLAVKAGGEEKNA
jgi:plasmid stability protein